MRGQGQKVHLTDDQKREAVRMHLEGGFSVRDVAESYGVDNLSVYNWVKKFGVEKVEETKIVEPERTLEATGVVCEEPGDNRGNVDVRYVFDPGPSRYRKVTLDDIKRKYPHDYRVVWDRLPREANGQG